MTFRRRRSRDGIRPGLTHLAGDEQGHAGRRRRRPDSAERGTEVTPSRRFPRSSGTGGHAPTRRARWEQTIPGEVGQASHWCKTAACPIASSPTFFSLATARRSGMSSGRRQGRSDSPLTAEGRRAVEVVATRIGGLQIDVIAASPLDRALTTAKVSARRCPSRSTSLMISLKSIKASGRVSPIRRSTPSFPENVGAERPTCINGAIQRAKVMRMPTVGQPGRSVTSPTSGDDGYSLFLTP